MNLASGKSEPVNPPVMQLDRVRFGYDKTRTIIHDVQSRLDAGRLCALIGPNAVGKSTLLRLMLGLCRPWSGTIKLQNQDIENFGPSRKAARISYVPQRGGSQFAFTVRQVVEMGRHALKPDADAVASALHLVSLNALADRVYAQLSAGQQQRVLLARAVAQASGQGCVILLDEPTSALDLRHAHQTMMQLKNLTRSGLAVLVVLHDINLAARYADVVWLMHKGRLTAAGPWSSVLLPEVLEPVYQVKLMPAGSQDQQRPIFQVKLRDGSPDRL